MTVLSSFFGWLGDFFAAIFGFLFTLETGLGFSYGTVLVFLIIADIAIYVVARALSTENKEAKGK